MKEHIFLDKTKLLFDFAKIQKFFEISKYFYLLAMFEEHIAICIEEHIANSSMQTRKNIDYVPRFDLSCFSRQFFKGNFSIDTIFCRIITSLIGLVFSYIRYIFLLSLKRIQHEKGWNVFWNQKNVEQKYFPQKKNFPT